MEHLTCRILPPSDWPQYKERLLALEQALFSPELSQTPEELEDTFTDKRAIFIVAFLGDELVGFVCGEFLRYYVEQGDPEYDELLEREGTMYVETIDVSPAHQGKGIGKALLAEFLAETRRRGYKHVSGHWRQGPSLGLVQKLGGTVRMTEDDYHGTGETYGYAVIDL